MTLARTTTPQQIRGNERARQALELRKAGVHYVDIARQLGYASHVGALNAVQRALKMTLQEPADDVRQLELERLDTMWAKTWEWVQNNDPRAIDRALRLMERRSRYLGLDAPKQVDLNIIKRRAQEVADRLGVPVADVMAQAERIAQEVLAGSDL